MSYIQLPYGLVRNEKQIQFNLPKNYEESQYIKRLPYIRDNGSQFDNSIINVIQNPNDLEKWLLATSDYGRELQEDLNAVASYHEKFNNAIVRHVLDRKDASVMKNPNPLNLTFRDAKKLDMQNPIIGKVTTQVKASKLTEDQLTRRILMQDQIYDIESRLEKLKHLIRMDSDNDGGGGGSGGGGGGDGGLPQTPLPLTPVRKPRPEKGSYDELMDRYNKLECSRPPHPITPSSSYSDTTYPLLPSFNDLLHLFIIKTYW